MFLRNEIKQELIGTAMVPFCKDCNSQEIETIQTCKKCGSHNITADWTDKRSEKLEFIEKEIHIYKCDKCGKEFDGFKTDKFIHFDGEFYPFKSMDDEDYTNEYVDNYDIGIDLCQDCKEKFVSILNREINNINNKEHILSKLHDLDNEEVK